MIFLEKNKEGKYTLFKNLGINYFVSGRNNFIKSLGFFNTNLIVLNNLFTPYKAYYVKQIFEKAFSRLRGGGIILSDELSKNRSDLQQFKKKGTLLKDNNTIIKGLKLEKIEINKNEFKTVEKSSIKEIEDALKSNQQKVQESRERIKEAQRRIDRYKVDPNDPTGSSLKIKKELMETAGYIDLKKENEELRETLRGLEKSYALTYKEQSINYKKMEEANLKLEDMKNNLVKNLINKTEELEKLNEVLSQFEKDRTFFYSKLSHDLRTPLNSVLGFSDVAMEGINDLESEQIVEYLSEINKSGKSLLNLGTSIYEFTKVDLEKLKIVDENFSTQQFLDELQALHENNCVIKGLRFELNKGSNLPTYLKADQSKMRQVLDNLIDNAVKFTDEGLVSLDVQAYYYAGKEDQF
ncbi:MAG: histidine kinase dimerization/phospho-acceptor domain-containing protein, partial [Bdellovibrionota bacterium]|nr:histidine kinase dimerization/phospho-acceptor domain-containing protein [Bdellovibrionota bacterium]